MQPAMFTHISYFLLFLVFHSLYSTGAPQGKLSSLYSLCSVFHHVLFPPSVAFSTYRVHAPYFCPALCHYRFVYNMIVEASRGEDRYASLAHFRALLSQRKRDGTWAFMIGVPYNVLDE